MPYVPICKERGSPTCSARDPRHLQVNPRPPARGPREPVWPGDSYRFGGFVRRGSETVAPDGLAVEVQTLKVLVGLFQGSRSILVVGEAPWADHLATMLMDADRAMIVMRSPCR